MPVSKKVAIVTGSSRGIGKSIAVSLAQIGWSLVINYRSHQDAALAVRQKAEEYGVGVMVIQADMGDLTAIHQLVEKTINHYGQVDLLVNNAGIAPIQRVDMLEVSEQSYDQVMTTNLKGPFFLTQRVANEMIRLVQQKIIQNPKIINIGSVSAYASSPSRAEYCISKAGLGMMTHLWADRLAEYGIHVYEVRAGIIETDMTATVKEKYDRLIADGLTPIRRWGHPEDVSKAVVAIAEGNFPFSTGQVIDVDGGFHIRHL